MKKSKLNVGVLGYGEVGAAIAALYKTPPYIRDLARDDFGALLEKAKTLDVLHVCIPYSDTFVVEVADTIKGAAQGIVFIHSTVPVGTSEAVRTLAGTDGIGVVHAPIRGVHPNLLQGLRTFRMYVGADSPTAGEYAAAHLASLGVKPMVLYKSRTSELLKLLDTTYYGLAIAYHDYAYKLCEKEGLNFDMVMTDANISYNQGYEQLDKKLFRRPVLYPPVQTGGKITGHCVIPNAKLLKVQYGSDPILQAILRHK